MKRFDWYEDPERPGVLVPVEPVELRTGDSFTLTSTVMVDDAGNYLTTLPWAEGTVTRQHPG